MGWEPLEIRFLHKIFLFCVLFLWITGASPLEIGNRYLNYLSFQLLKVNLAWNFPLKYGFWKFSKLLNFFVQNLNTYILNAIPKPIFEFAISVLLWGSKLSRDYSQRCTKEFFLQIQFKLWFPKCLPQTSKIFEYEEIFNAS